MSFRDFKVLTFDVVGTLIDFESGILRAVRRISGKTPAELSDDRIFEAYKRGRDAHYERSSEVMGLVYLHLAKELGIPADSSAAEAFQMEVLRWPAFPDSAAALKRLRARFRLVAMTNADRSAFSFYSHTLGNPFHDSVTADEARCAKPDPQFFAFAGGSRWSATRWRKSCMSRKASTTTSASPSRLDTRLAGSSDARDRRALAARRPSPS
jgi:putative hydrolase of the HAD superfamily